MFQAILVSLVQTFLAYTLAVQVPLGSDQHWQHKSHSTTLGDGDLGWNLYTLPNPNGTDHLVFETVHSFLQHWPNTRMRNGHNIVPGNVPKGTLLYHGRSDDKLPSGPDWTATDPEHSCLFCRSLFDQSQQGCWHLTLMTTRPLRIVYFDGNSAAKLPYGTLDTQDLITRGKTNDDATVDDETRRIQDLCEWGESLGVDGFVRMEMDFEVMLCSFTSGVDVVSFVNLRGRLVNGPETFKQNSFESMNAGSWHNHFPGETRVQLDLTRLVSFYDTRLVPSLVATRADQQRWDHRVKYVSSEDLSAVKSRLEANLMRPDSTSGIDWKTLIRAVVDRYAQRLELTRYLLNASVTSPDGVLGLARKVQTQLQVMLTPYILLSATPVDLSDQTDLVWTIPIYQLCATTHTHSMESRFDFMTDSEKLLLQAVRGTNREICRVVTKMWAAGIYAGISPLLNTRESPDIAEVAHLLTTWSEELDHLMTWLDWSVWVKCDPGCGPEARLFLVLYIAHATERQEMCYLPTWPVGFPRPGDGRHPGRRPPPSPDRPDGPHLQSDKRTDVDVRIGVIANIAEVFGPGLEEWVRPQPKCVRRFEPYDL